jgi:hydrogenase/urease accessory protein HupE
MKRYVVVPLTVASAAITPWAEAHTGDGAEHVGLVKTVLHVLSEPDHLAILAAVVVGAPLIATLVRRVIQNVRRRHHTPVAGNSPRKPS